MDILRHAIPRKKVPSKSEPTLGTLPLSGESDKLSFALYSHISNFMDSYREPVLKPGLLQSLCQQFQYWQDISRSESRRRDSHNRAFQRKVVHYLVERFFWERCDDSHQVARLLVSFFEIEGHLLKVIIPSFQPDDIGLQTTWTKEKLAKAEVTPLTYFLCHAYRARLLFDSRRFCEAFVLGSARIPAYYVLYHCSSPEALLLFFKHGVFLEEGNMHSGRERCKKFSDLFFWMVRDISSLLLPPRITLNDLKLPPALQMTLVHFVSCGNLLFRVLPPSFDALRDHRFVPRRLENCLRVLESRNHVARKLLSRCCGLPELKHLCRFRIRKTLYDYWQLPHGIAALPLPSSLKRYLDLESD